MAHSGYLVGTSNLLRNFFERPMFFGKAFGRLYILTGNERI